MIKGTSKKQVNPLFGTLALSVLFTIAACGKLSGRSADSDVQDFTGPQLMGHGLASGTVSLTFDDGPGPRTVELSKFLKAEGVRGTFFIQGSAAARYPEALKQLQADGHLVANHTYTHPRMTAAADPVDEVRRTDQLIKPFVDQGRFLFRAPYGDWSPRVATILNSAGLTKYVGSVFWDIGGVRTARPDGSLASAADWACWAQSDTVEKCLEGYMNESRELNRGIILLHDVHSRTIDLTKLLVKELKQEGFSFVRTDEVPSVVAALAKRTSTGDTLPPDAFACPEGFTATPVGNAGALLCLSETEAQGPFTQGMQNACREKGGGESCANSRWSRGMAVWLHGSGRCPLGATLDSTINTCVEGENAFGPFTKKQVKRCRSLSADPNSPVCEGNRWSKGFLASVGQG